MHNRLVLNLFGLIIILLIASPLVGPARAQTPEPPLPIELKGRLLGKPAHYPVAGPEAAEPGSFTPRNLEGMDAWSKIAFQSYRTGDWDIYVAPPDGKDPVNITNHPASDARARLNRGATHIVFNTDRDGNFEIYSVKTDRTELKRLTINDKPDSMPDWSPDGTQIVFVSSVDKSDEIFRMNADGSGLIQLTFERYNNASPVWSPDGSQFAFVRIGGSGYHGSIWLMNADGTNPRALTGDMRYLQDLSWSPDGKSLAFDADNDNDYWNEIWQISLNDLSVKLLYDYTVGGNIIADAWMGSWSPNGEWILFTRVDYSIVDGNLYIDNTMLAKYQVNTRRYAWINGSGVDMLPDWKTADITPPSARVSALPAFSHTTAQIEWSGSDAGPAGVKSYEVQYRKTSSGEWTTWFGETNETSGVFTGDPGIKYFFRARARDNAGNVQEWQGDQADTYTTLFTWLIAGSVLDNRGKPVANVPIQISPRPLSPTASDAAGEYQAYMKSIGRHVLQLSKSGYGALPDTVIELNDDLHLLQVLPPNDNQAANGNFEQGNLSSWQKTGEVPPLAAGEAALSGKLGAFLGNPTVGKSGMSILSKEVNIPANLHLPTLSFAYSLYTQGDPSLDWLEVWIDDGGQKTSLATLSSSSDWRQLWFDMEDWRGKTVTLMFELHLTEDGNDTWVYLDDVSLGSWLTPVVSSVTPNRIEGRGATQITITGENFISNPRVRLGEFWLAQVTWINAQTLQAQVPANLPPGTYDLWVANPGGQEGLLPASIRTGQYIFLPGIGR